MPLFMPDISYDHITDVPVKMFLEKGIKLVVLDVDNTLTTHDNPTPADGVEAWIASAQNSGIRLAILSNNKKERVKPFARKLGLDFVSRACKPLTFGLTRACKRYRLSPREVCLIGDQLFTDMMAGNLKGVFTILVKPYELENAFFLRLKRKLESPFLKRYARKGK